MPYYCHHKLEAKSLQESIDKVKMEAMHYAESKCRKYGMGNVPFSPKVLIWKNRHDFWSLVIRFHKGHKVSRSVIKRRAKEYGIVAPLSGNLASACSARHKCAQEYLRPNPN